MKPAARVTFNGNDVTTDWQGVLASITITDESGGKADSAEFVIDNKEGLSAPPIDGIVQVWLGYEPAPVLMGTYKVASWKKGGAPNTLTVTARTADLTTEMKGRKARSWHGTTVASIAQQIAAENGLSAIVDSGIGAHSVPHIDQQTESDMGFLSRLAKRHGAVFKVAQGKLIIAAKGSSTKPSGSAKSAITLKPTDVSSWEVTQEERGRYGAVKCFYFDGTTAKHVYVMSGTGKPVHRDPRRYGSQAEAQAAADAQMGDLGRATLTGEIEGAGNTALFAEALVTLSGFDPDADGTYLAKSVTHTFDSSGYKTSVHLEQQKDT